MSVTDREWQKWGEKDPYYGVLTAPEYRKSVLNEEKLDEFFQSGERDLEDVFSLVQRLKPGFTSETVLDYGCGVGRVLIAMTKRFQSVTGIDVSPAMLSEATHNLDSRGITNFRLRLNSEMDNIQNESYDFVHSYIVLQHIPAKDGEQIVRQLLRVLKFGGIGAIHVTFERQASIRKKLSSVLRRVRMLHLLMNFLQNKPTGDPSMRMTEYSLNEIYSILYSSGIRVVMSKITKHVDVLGIMLVFEKSL